MKIRITKKGLPKAQLGFYNTLLPQLGSNIQEYLNLKQDPLSLIKRMKSSGFEFPMRSYTLTENTDGVINSTRGFITKEDTEALDTTPSFNKRLDELDNLIKTGSKKDIRQGIKSFNTDFAGSMQKPLDMPGMFTMGAKGRKLVEDVADPFNVVGSGIKLGTIVGSGLTDMAERRRKEKDFSNWMRNQMSSDALYKPVEGSRGDYVTTGSRFGEFRPDEYVVNRGMFAQYGGENTEIMKIRITQVPASNEMKYGGQSNYGLDLGRKAVYGDMPESRSESMGSSISAVPRYAANVEAEGGETVLADMDQDGVMEHMKISGPRHSEGGVPLNIPEGSFIFSDTKKMKIKDPTILAMFGKTYKKGGITPAQIAKQYDINKYKAILEDPNSDELSKSTAQLMVNNYNKKLADLSIIQEGMKGFPQGMPQVAQSLKENDQLMMAAYGGYMDLPKAQLGLPGVGAWNATQSYSPAAYGPGQGVNPRSMYSTNTVVVNNKDKNKPPITIKEEDIFNPTVIENLKKQGYEIKYSPRIAKGDVKVPVKQSKQKSGLYGDVQMDEIAEFKARHPWYFANKPNWNPANPADVFDFQTKYDEEFAKQKGYSYFDGSKPFSKKDKKLGEYTYNAPGLASEQGPSYFGCDPVSGGVVQLNPNNPALKYQVGVFTTYEAALAACTGKKTPPKKQPPTEENPPNKLVTAGEDPLPFGYMTPDLVNLAAAAMLPPKKYLPYRAPINLPRVSPTFYDPNRAIAAQNEAANMLAQNAALIGNPQAYMANAARLQGTLAQGVADTMADVQNRNVGVANQFAGINADIIGKENMLNAQRVNDLYDATAIANQQFDNSRRLYNRNLASSFSQAWNNRMNLGMLNAVNPVYRVNPATGRSYFVRGYDPYMIFGRGSGSSSPAAGANSFRDLKNKFMQEGYSESLAERKADQALSGGKGTTSYIDNDMDGYPDRASYSAGAQNLLPYFMAMQKFLPRPGSME